jgi:2,3-bisphosphoglycerate-dependent phosphoglycerate mutase/probable phosphoglycerate mutase
MWRALQTARPIGEALGLTPEVWIDIHEVGGIFLDHDETGQAVGYPGQTRPEILAEFPNYILPKGITEEGWWNNGREDWPGCLGRSIRVADELRNLAEQVGNDERVALVTHGGFIDALLKALLNLLPGRHMAFYHYNTAITRLDFWDDGRLGLRYVNRVPHLSPKMIS